VSKYVSMQFIDGDLPTVGVTLRVGLTRKYFEVKRDDPFIQSVMEIAERVVGDADGRDSGE
jgi:hypothetical protein